MGLIEAEDIKKRWQEHMEELYKKDLHNSDNHNGVITHLEPDILECEVKWALESISANKASGGGGFPVELGQILKGDAVKVGHSVCQENLENSAIATELENVGFYSSPKEKQCQRMLNLPNIALISHASKVKLKILQARLQQYVNYELKDVQSWF